MNSVRPSSKPTRPAVFLDRDDTLVANVPYLSDPADLRLLPGASEALGELRRAGFALVLITNQSAVGRGLITEAKLHEIHDELNRLLAEQEAALDAVYFCPDLPLGDDRTIVENPNRKPGPGMLHRATAELGLDLDASWMVGDLISDVLAGLNAGCRSILVGSNATLSELPDQTVRDRVYAAADLAAAAELILESPPPATPTSRATQPAVIGSPEAEPAAALRIAYLINIYPMTSASFIRRELLEIEAQGASVARFTLRRWDTPLVDPVDLEEARKTRAILEVGALGLAKGLAVSLLRRPVKFARALGLTWRLGRRGRGSDQGFLRQLIYLAEACILLDWSRDLKIDHVHAHYGSNSTTVALLCRMLGGPPYSFTTHGPEEFDRPLALGLDYKISGAAFAVAISEHGRSQLCRWAPYDQWSKIKVVHCGLDPMFLDAPRVPLPEARKLVCVGRFAEQKGLPVLLEAAGRLRAEGVSFDLTLVGDGALRNEIEALVKRYRLEDCVHLVGWKTNAEVRDLILGSRALVLPSFAEGLPVAIMESLALGRPVISTWVAGTPELVEPGVCGWLVPPGSAEALATAVRELLDTPLDDLERMGERGAERVARRHNIVTEARKLRSLIG